MPSPSSFACRTRQMPQQSASQSPAFAPRTRSPSPASSFRESMTKSMIFDPAARSERWLDSAAYTKKHRRSPSPHANRRSVSLTPAVERFDAPWQSEDEPLLCGPPPPITQLQKSRGKPNSNSSGTASLQAHHSWIEHGGSLIKSMFGSNSKAVPASHEPGDIYWRCMQARRIQMHQYIQELLNSQVQALNQDSGTRSTRSLSHDRSTTLSTSILDTSTTRVAPDGHIIPVRQSRSAQPSIRDIREHLSQALVSFVAIVVEERTHVSAVAAERQQALDAVNRLLAETARAAKALKSVDENPDDPLRCQINELESQNDKLLKEIADLEAQLLAKRVKQKHVSAKLHQLTQTREGALSSYRGALREVQKEAQAWLTHLPVKPLEHGILGNTTMPRGADEGEMFLSLRAERRTLGMAKSWLTNDLEALYKKHAELDSEVEALQLGIEMWNRSVDLITAFESVLGTQIKRKNSTVRAEPHEDFTNQEDTSEAVYKTNYAHMEHVTEALLANLQEARQNKWNLLICALGAEHQAFDKGLGILRRIMKSHGYEVSETLSSKDSAMTDSQATIIVSGTKSAKGKGKTVDQRSRAVDQKRTEDTCARVIGKHGAGEKQPTDSDASKLTVENESDNNNPADLLVNCSIVQKSGKDS